MGTKSGPRHDRNFKDLEQLKPDTKIRYIGKSNGSVRCSVEDPYHNWFVDVPKYAFDAISKDGLSTVGDINNYIRDHPHA